jgi:hypothetical protein
MLFHQQLILTLRLLLLSGLLSSACLLTSCASVSALLGHKAASLPVRFTDSYDSRLISLHTFEAFGRLRITGMAAGSKTKLGHIDFELLDRNGGIVSSSKTYIYPSYRLIGGPDNYYFASSFPLDVAAKATEIRVVFHRISHGPQMQ